MVPKMKAKVAESTRNLGVYQWTASSEGKAVKKSGSWRRRGLGYNCTGGPRIEDERGVKGVKVLAVVQDPWQRDFRKLGSCKS